METNRIIKQLQDEFPGRDISVVDGLISVEVERADDRSVVVAYIDHELGHYHTEREEAYAVEEGELSLHEAGKLHVLTPGQEYTVFPGRVHSAMGDSTRVRITSTPGRTGGDHTHFPKR